MISDEDLKNWFTYHSPKPEQLVKYQGIREAGLTLATVIRDHTPPSADQTAAIRKVREAVMTANAAIACSGEEAAIGHHFGLTEHDVETQGQPPSERGKVGHDG